MNIFWLFIQFSSLFSIWNVQAQQQLSKQLGFNIDEFTTVPPDANANGGSNQTIIKVAMLVAQNTTDFGLARSNAILCNTGGAVPMALERLWNEGVLPRNVNFSFQWRYEKCKRPKAVGYSYQFIRYSGADAIIPSSCIDVPPTIGQLATNTNIPMVLWGPCMAQEMSNWNSYRTLVNIVPNYKSMTILMMEMFRYFNWTQFAVVIQSDLGVSAGCYQFAQSLDSAKNNYPDIQISYKVRIFNLASADSNSIIQLLNPRARIIVLCFDDIVQQRLFALKLYDNGMNTSDYAYILPDFDMALSFNLTRLPFWVQNRGNLNSTTLLDGRDADAEVIGRLSFWFHYDITLSDLSNSDYNGFYSRVLTKAQEWPFYCDTSKLTNGSIYSMLLYDAIYDYGLALNASFSKYGISPDIYRNGTLISSNSRSTFMGMTGKVVIENNDNSRPLVMSRRKPKEEGNYFTIILQFSMVNGKVNITVRNMSAAWLAPFKGTVPLAIPQCGFDGNGCPISPFEAYKGYIIAGIVLFFVVIIGIVFLIAYIIYSNIRNKEQKNLLWQISFTTLTRIKEKTRSHTERSERSIHSGPSSTSTFGTNNSSVSNNVALSKGLALYSYNGEKCVGQKHGSSALVQLNEMDMAELRMMRLMDHDNLNRFYGLSLDSVEAISVWKFCSRGSIRDMIASGNALTKDQVFVQSILWELSEGLTFLHNSELQFHGRLRSSCCLVDERWQVKITQFGLRNMKSVKKQKTEDLLWKAPEQLRSVPGDQEFMEGTKQGDIYTLGLIFTEVVNMRPCWEENEEGGENARIEGAETEIDSIEGPIMLLGGRRTRGNHPNNSEQVDNDRQHRCRRQQHRQARNKEEILYLVKRGGLIPLRPNIRPAIEGLDPTLIHLIRECWAEEAAERPTIRQIRETLRSILRSQQNANLMDHVFSMLEQYATKLEEEVEERTRELAEEKKKSDLLLYRMLPRQIADRLKIGHSVEPEHYECVTVFFSDVVAFAALSNRMRPLQVVMLMNELYTVFDSIINEYDVYKVESIGDGYLCVSGLPKRNGNQHVKECADMALKFMCSLGTFHVEGLPPGESIRLRIGLHSGNCMAGVVGLAMPRYCLFGDTVNTASRMESSSSPNKIHISNDTYQLLTKHFDGYSVENRGEIIIKGKGVMQTFWLLGHSEIGHIPQMNGAIVGGTNAVKEGTFHSKLSNQQQRDGGNDRKNRIGTGNGSPNSMYKIYKNDAEI